MPRRKRDNEPDADLDAAPAAKPDTEPKQKASPVRMVKRESIESAVGLVNGLIAVVSPGDALSMGNELRAFSLDISNEFATLVEGLDGQQKTSPRFRKWLGRFCTATGGANLLGIIGLLIYVRMERRGMVPNLTQSGGTAAPARSGDTDAPVSQPSANGAVVVGGVMPVGGRMDAAAPWLSEI